MYIFCISLESNIEIFDAKNIELMAPKCIQSEMIVTCQDTSFIVVLIDFRFSL